MAKHKRFLRLLLPILCAVLLLVLLSAVALTAYKADCTPGTTQGAGSRARTAALFVQSVLALLTAGDGIFIALVVTSVLVLVLLFIIMHKFFQK